MKQSLIIVISMLFLGANAQDSTKMREDALNVFIDCSNAFCDEDYIRQNLSWVNYVRDRKAAQLHLLISSQSTAGNGDEFLLDFIGLKEFEGLEFQLTYSTNSTQTRDEIRAEVVEVIKMGFMPFVAKTNLVNGFEIRYEFEEELKDEKVEDKWKSWVVDISTNGWFNGQESRQSLDLFSNFSVKKITDKWKYVFGFFNSFNENKFKFEDEVIVSTRKSNSFDGKVIRSLGPKFSYGAFADVSSSTFRNIDLSAALYTGFEYNFFPYSESSRHMLRVNYGVGAKQNDYTETTILIKTKNYSFNKD